MIPYELSYNSEVASPHFRLKQNIPKRPSSERVLLPLADQDEEVEQPIVLPTSDELVHEGWLCLLQGRLGPRNTTQMARSANLRKIGGFYCELMNMEPAIGQVACTITVFPVKTPPGPAATKRFHPL